MEKKCINCENFIEEKKKCTAHNWNKCIQRDSSSFVTDHTFFKLIEIIN